VSKPLPAIDWLGYLEAGPVGQIGSIPRFVDYRSFARFLNCRLNPTVSIMGFWDIG
jgi:hypothetical protein